MTNFSASKTVLSLKYRLGLEHALAAADFLNKPDVVLIQAFAIFLLLARRHDSPRFVWMLTGLLTRMAQYLGLQRDGSNFDHLPPFETEIRRRVWWTVYSLDMRASQDQGTDPGIASGSFDTKMPSNINDADIHIESRDSPPERDGVTDSTFARIFAKTTDIQNRMMAADARNGGVVLEDQQRLLNEIYKDTEQQYLRYMTESVDVVDWVAVAVARLTMAKMTLLVFLPAASPGPNEHLSDEIKNKLLISAIEVAEYNHELNAAQTAKKWRWVYQSYVHVSIPLGIKWI